MPPFDPETFAAAWAAAWNARDLDTILSHFTEQVVFSTPKALETVGTPTVTGRNALRAYWEKALGRIRHLRFTVVRTVWDPTRRELGVIYDRQVNDARDRALELLTLSPAGQVVAGEVFYGVVPAP
jgi:SnoaL-like domain